jgi:hypothetical protein
MRHTGVIAVVDYDAGGKRAGIAIANGSRKLAHKALILSSAIKPRSAAEFIRQRSTRC